MKRYIFRCLLIFALLGYTTGIAQDERDPALLIGRVNVRLLQSNQHFAWFTVNYSNYVCNSSAIKVLSQVSPDISFIVFGGTWSDASQTLLPQFYKVLDEAKINRGRALLYFLDRDKKSPQGFESEYMVSELPTIILLKGGQEVGRISGNVSTSVEGDLADLVVR